jgi:hypothetical protein
VQGAQAGVVSTPGVSRGRVRVGVRGDEAPGPGGVGVSGRAGGQGGRRLGGQLSLYAKEILIAGGHGEGVSAGQFVARGEEVGDCEDTPLSKGVRVPNKVEREGRVVGGGHVPSGGQGGESARDIVSQVAAGDECGPDAGF